MKLAIRISALCVVLAGATAVSFSSATTHAIVSHQSATAGMLIPLCGPGIPCGPSVK